MSTSYEGSIKAVHAKEVIVLVSGMELKIPKERVYQKGRPVKQPCIGKKVYVSSDYSSCDMEPSYCYRQSIPNLPAVPNSLRQLLSEYQTCAVFQTWDQIRWLGYLVFHLFKSSAEVREHMYSHVTKLCTNPESWNCFDAFQSMEQNYSADDLLVDRNWDEVKQAYGALVDIIMRRMDKQRSAESDCSLVFNIYLQIYRDGQSPRKRTSEEVVSIKAKAIELPDSLKIVLLPTIPAEPSILETARFYHIEPSDSSREQEDLEQTLNTRIDGQVELLGKMMLLSAQMTEAVANLSTTSLLTLPQPTQPLIQFFDIISEPKVREQLCYCQDLGRFNDTIKASSLKLCCKMCNSNIKALTFQCGHSYCETCLRSHMMTLFEKQEGLFLNDDIPCKYCNYAASAEETSLVHLGIQCSDCPITKGLAKCGKGKYHCKKHMVSKIRKAYCDSCKKRYKPEEVEKAKLTEYDCMLCHESGALKDMGDDLRCDCVYHNNHKKSGQAIGVCVNCHGLATR